MISRVLFQDTPQGTVAFSSNRSACLNVRNLSGAVDSSESMGMHVFAMRTGSLLFTSHLHELEVDNPMDYQEIRDVYISSVFGIIVSMSQHHVQVWDCLRSVDGVRINPIHTVVIPSKPRSLYLMKSDNSCFVGLENGKVMVMNLHQCATASPLPRYTASPYMDATGPAVTAIAGSGSEYLILGGADGTIRIVKYATKKLVTTIKTPQSGCAVTGITVLDAPSGSPPDTPPSMMVCFDAPVITMITNNSAVALITSLPCPAKSAFSTTQPGSPIIALLTDNRLVRIDGPKWAHCSPAIPEGARCLLLRPQGGEGKKFQVIQRDVKTGITGMKTYTVQPGLGPIVSVDYPVDSLGSLSMGSTDRLPVQSVSLPRADSSLEPNLIRLCNHLTKWPASSTNRFVFDYAAGLWEGVIASVVNSPCELVFSVYSQSSALVMARIPISIPPMAVVSALSVSAFGTDRWSVLLGFSSGQVGLMESTIDHTYGHMVWGELWLLDAPETVHSGARVKSVDRSLMDNKLVVSVDVNGMVCFTRIDEPSTVKKSRSIAPAYVAIAGEAGNCFPDPTANCCYVCMSDGGIERIRTPRKDEDAYDTTVWEAVTMTVDSIPLEGEFIALYPSLGIAVRESGFVLMTFPSKPEEATEIRKSVALKPDFGDRIIAAEIASFPKETYLVILTETSVAAYDVKDGFCVFNRSHVDEEGSAVPPVLLKSMHVFRWGVSLTSILFADRSKLLLAGEATVVAAQTRYGFPPIRSAPLLAPEVPTPKGTATPDESVSGKKKGIFSNLFGKPELTKEEKKAQFKPTSAHLDEARAQLEKNLEAMAKLQDDAAEMQNASADFLSMATDLNDGFSGKKKKKKFFGLI